MSFVSQRRFALRAAFGFLLASLASAQTAEQIRQSDEAKQFMSTGRFDAAVPLYQDLTKQLPANAGIRLNLALALHMSGRHAEAIPVFEKVLQSDPKSVPALISLGAAYLETGQPAKAVAPLRTFVTIDPNHVPARGMLANALLSTGQAKEALVHFRKLATLTPDDPKAIYGLGRSYETLAQAAFEELNKTRQGSAEWLTLMGESRLKQRQYRSAFYFFKQGLEKNKTVRGAHAGIAEVYRNTDHPDWAEAEAKKEPALDCVREKAACAFAKAQYQQAAAAVDPYWRARAYDRLALDTFRKLGTLPPSVELHTLKAQMLASHGNELEAVNEWRSALNLSPGNPMLEVQLAIALYQAKSYAAAIAALEPLLERHPDAADLQVAMGDSFLQLAEPEKAIGPLERAVRSDPKHLPARASLGMAYARLGRSADAVPHLEAAIELDDDGSLHYQLARAYQAAGVTDKAQTMMQKYLEIQRRAEEEKQTLEREAVITPP
jgi:tetratricopeptide (TPR) repeat protein